MRFAKDRPLKIVMLGAGGTGAHVAPNIYRLLYAIDRPARYIIADGDSVETKNLVRQHFSVAELGQNKARALAVRYAEAFGMAPEYIPDFIENKERLKTLVEPEIFALNRYSWDNKTGQHVPATVSELVILIGAVDNNRSRRMCHEVFMEARDLIYIDSGNGEFSGQIVCGVRRTGKTMFKPVGLLYPDILQDTDKFPTELSCA